MKIQEQFKNSSLISVVNGFIVIKDASGKEHAFNNALVISVNNGTIIIESEWEPKKGELIYIIQGNGEILDSYYDNSMRYYQQCIEIGNCFKTRKEAEIKLNQIKNLFKE